MARIDPEFLAEAMSRVEAELKICAEATSKPVLFLISGLPGTGKSFLSRRLAARISCVIVETDLIRKLISPSPTYTPKENECVYAICHALIRELLMRGYRVVFDATNLIERNREILYHIADQVGAKLIIIRTVASEEAIRQRIAKRKAGADPQNRSDAGWTVHQKMKAVQERIGRNYFVIDTTQEIDSAVEKILRLARN